MQDPIYKSNKLSHIIYFINHSSFCTWYLSIETKIRTWNNISFIISVRKPFFEDCFLNSLTIRKLFIDNLFLDESSIWKSLDSFVFFNVTSTWKSTKRFDLSCTSKTELRFWIWAGGCKYLDGAKSNDSNKKFLNHKKLVR
jgi:hypothetical protein